MINIESYKFNKNIIKEMEETKYANRWPSVYIINNAKEAYIGETLNACRRTKEHLKNKERKPLKFMNLITSETFNKSVTLELESFLIKHMSADGKYKLQNSTTGLQSHDYYKREEHERDFNDIWNRLKEKELVVQDLKDIENSDLFKYSPYKNLTEDQYIAIENIAEDLSKDISDNVSSTFLVKGGAGTGKTVLAIYLIKLIYELKNNKAIIGNYENEYTIRLGENLKDLKVALVVPMDPLRTTLRKVFKQIKGLKANMVISPSQAIKGQYDLLIVDEAHRLKRRRNLTSYDSFDKNNEKLGLGKEGTELDWIKMSSKYQILFYDRRQTIKPTDVRRYRFKEIEEDKKNHVYELVSQLRCKGGNDYIDYVEKIFSDNPPAKKKSFGNYGFVLYDNVKQMTDDIIEKNKEFELCRNVAGYAWKWNTKGYDLETIKRKGLYDIEIDGYRYIWNTTKKDFINSKNAINEIGCIHTSQGYDLNYTGVIIGNDIKYDKNNKKIIIDKNNYFDSKGKDAVDNEEELKEYIVNIYVTLLTRGIEGTYVYVCDKNLRQYLKKYINTK